MRAMAASKRHTRSLESRVRVRQYRSIRRRAILRIAEDLLGADLSATLTARVLEGGAAFQGATTGRGIATAVSLLAALVFTILRIALPEVWQGGLNELGGSSQPSIAGLPAPVYFLPLAVFLVVGVLCGVRLRAQPRGWSINWNRTVFLAYVLGGLAGVCILVFGQESGGVVELIIWLSYILVLAASSVVFFALFHLLGWRHSLTKLDFIVLFSSCAVSTTVVLCGAVGVAALPEGWIGSDGGRIALETAFYVFPWATFSFVFAVMVFYPRWLDFRRAVRASSESMEQAASRALTRWAQGHAGAVSQTRIDCAARELGISLGPALLRSNVTRYVMFLVLETDRASGRGATKWSEVSRFQSAVFEEAILRTALADYEVRETDDTTELEKATISARSELVSEQVGKAVALRCATFLYDQHRRRSTNGVILVGEGLLMYAAAVTRLAADLTCRLPTVRLVEEDPSEPTPTAKAYDVLRRCWRKI